MEGAESKDEKISEIEKTIGKIQEKLPEIKNFIIDGEDELSALCQIGRAIARRAAREISTVNQEFSIDNNILTYMNRLSDLLFVLARYYSLKNKKEDFLWVKK